MSMVSLNGATRAAPPACRLPAILLGLAPAAFHGTAFSVETDIRIVTVKGEVRITADGKDDVSAGTVDVGLEVLDTGIDVGLGGDSLIDVDAGSAPEAEDSGGLLGGILRRVGL